MYRMHEEWEDGEPNTCAPPRPANIDAVRAKLRPGADDCQSVNLRSREGGTCGWMCCVGYGRRGATCGGRVLFVTDVNRENEFEIM